MVRLEERKSFCKMGADLLNKFREKNLLRIVCDNTVKFESSSGVVC